MYREINARPPGRRKEGRKKEILGKTSEIKADALFFRLGKIFPARYLNWRNTEYGINYGFHYRHSTDKGRLDGAVASRRLESRRDESSCVYASDRTIYMYIHFAAVK